MKTGKREVAESRVITARLLVSVRVDLEFDEDGNGHVLFAELAQQQMISPRDVEEALDTDGELSVLDKDEQT